MLANQANKTAYKLREHIQVYSVDKRWLRDPAVYNSQISDSGYGLEEISGDFSRDLDQRSEEPSQTVLVE